MKKSLILLISILLITSIFSLGCNPPATKKAKNPEDLKPVNGDWFVEGSIGDAKSLNDILSSDDASTDIIKLVFDMPLEYNYIDEKWEPRLAKSWEFDKTGKVLTFKLKQGIKWHDGEEFTAYDIEYNYKKIMDPTTKTIKSGSYKEVESAKAIDKYTFQVTYKKLLATFVALEKWEIRILPKHLFEKEKDFNSAKYNRSPIGTGPYKFVHWKADQEIVLEANDNYFRKRPKIDKYIYKIIPDKSVQFNMLKSKQIDYMEIDPVQYTREVKPAPQLQRIFKVYPYFRRTYYYIGWNQKKSVPFFHDKKVRRALTMSINREEMIQGVVNGLGEICTGPFFKFSKYYNHDVKAIKFNPDNAKKILEEAGWKDSNGNGIRDKVIDGKKVEFDFEIMTNQGNKQREMIATIVQQRLKEVGIKVRIKILEWSVFLKQYIEKGNFDSCILGWVLTADPDSGKNLWNSEMTPGKGQNHIYYSNPEIDKLFEDGSCERDPQKRALIYKKIHKILNEEQPYTFLYIPKRLPTINTRFYNINAKDSMKDIDYNYLNWFVPKSLQQHSK